MPSKNYRLLPKLFKQVPVETVSPVPVIYIRGIALDSREVRPGDLFVALSGGLTDGHRFIPQAIRNGAVAILGDHGDVNSTVPYIQVKGSTRRAMAYLAAALHGFPAHKMTMIGVTGTDGKTTTTMMIHRILANAGIRTGMISTVSAVIGGEERDTGFHVTTPESPAIQSYLADMVTAGVTHVVLETTSHGLAQERVTGCEYDLGVVTNVTHEHLDYHGTYEAYLQAKGRLFEMLSQTPRKRTGNIRAAILNKDDQSYSYMKRVSPPGFISYSMINEADIWADHIVNTPEELRFTCHFGNKSFPVKTK